MWLIALVVILIFARLPIALAMLLGASIFIAFDDSVSLDMIPLVMSYSLDSFPLLAIPFFILAAEIMNSAGITEKIFDFFRRLVGHHAGALGHVNVMCSMLFAGMSGSGVADAAGLGKIEVKAMLEDGYDRPFSAAITASSSTIGPIIPPSIGVVILAYVSGTSVGQLLLAGLVPGIAMGIGLMTVVAILSRRRNYPRHARSSLTEIGDAFRGGFLAMLTPIILIGGIVSGVFSPTEAAVVCVLYSTVLGFFIFRTLSLRVMKTLLAKAAVESAVILFLAGAAKVIGLLLVIDRVPQRLFDIVSNLPLTGTQVIILTLVLVLALGCIIDDLSLLLIIGPILVPLAVKLGFDPVHFGILFLATLTIGMITPPIGIGMFVLCSITDTPISEFARESLPFVFVLVVVIFSLLFMPDIVLFLPRLVGM